MAEYVAVSVGEALDVHSIYLNGVLATVGPSWESSTVARFGGACPGPIATPPYAAVVGVSEKKWGVLLNAWDGSEWRPLRQKRGSASWEELQPLAGGTDAEGVYLHDNGDVYGWSHSGTGVDTPVLWPATGGSPTSFPVPPGDENFGADAIGFAYGGVVINAIDERALYLYAGGVFKRLSPEGTIVSSAVVNKGKVFGSVHLAPNQFDTVAVEFKVDLPPVFFSKNQKIGQSSEALCYGANFFAGSFERNVSDGRTYGVTFGAKNDVGYLAVRDTLGLLVDDVRAIGEGVSPIIAGIGRDFATNKKVAWVATKW